jgi:pentatricopeptide repeat domain-containing protein 1
VPNEITYSAAISAREKGSQWRLALNLLSLMPETRVVPDEITYSAAISACGKGGQVAAGARQAERDARSENGA